MAGKWCLIFAVFLQISAMWVFAQQEKEFDFSLIQEQIDSSGIGVGAGAGASNETSSGGATNDTAAVPEAAHDQPSVFNPADFQQDQGAAVMPTRAPSVPNQVSTFPPLVHQDGTTAANPNATANGTSTNKPTPTEKAPKNEKGGSADFYGNFALVLFSAACVLHLLY